MFELAVARNLHDFAVISRHALEQSVNAVFQFLKITFKVIVMD